MATSDAKICVKKSAKRGKKSQYTLVLSRFARARNYFLFEGDTTFDLEISYDGTSATTKLMLVSWLARRNIKKCPGEIPLIWENSDWIEVLRGVRLRNTTNYNSKSKEIKSTAPDYTNYHDKRTDIKWTTNLCFYPSQNLFN